MRFAAALMRSDGADTASVLPDVKVAAARTDDDAIENSSATQKSLRGIGGAPEGLCRFKRTASRTPKVTVAVAARCQIATASISRRETRKAHRACARVND